MKGVDESELKITIMSKDTKNKIFVADLTALKDSGLTVVLITGWNNNSGTSAEISYTYAKGKPIIGIDASERRFRNLIVEGIISEKVNDIAGIIPAVKRKLPEWFHLNMSSNSPIYSYTLPSNITTVIW